jgi:hypothetical protein
MTSAPNSSIGIGEILGQDAHPLLAIDLDTMAIVGANEATYELLGSAPHSLEDAPVTE